MILGRMTGMGGVANTAVKSGAWIGVSILGAVAMALIALSQGETINAIWIVIASACTYMLAYRFYSRFIADKLLGLDNSRPTPAVRMNDGLDYVPTNNVVLFGHHFAAIAGAGPLIGPVLAAQMGYLPSVIWILVGAVFAGCVQDMVVLFFSTRRNGDSLGQMIKKELGREAGAVALIGVLAIMIILLAVLGLVVVKALAESPWGTFTVAMTIPIAVLMGVYMRFIRPGRIGEASIIGLVLMFAALVGGASVAAHPTLSVWFTLTGTQLAWSLIIYGFIASVLPVWLVLAPRDYLSTFLKIGTILLLAIGIVFTMPELKMPALTQFIDGSGPVWSGNLFPFLFITIACGAVSGFHSLIASGTTPKMVEKESDIRSLGYGAMIVESFVAVMALTAACVLDPAVYFALNSPAAVIGTSAESAAQTISQWGFVVTPETLTQMAKDVGEGTILSRTGGAPTLAVGMAQILSSFLGGTAMMAFWYHFAILFEALFILTTLDAGTRVARFMIQDLLGAAAAPLGRTTSLAGNLLATTLCVAGWGYFLYQGVVDPLGGINTLWPLFGISNQMLAAIALTLATVLIVKSGRVQYVWVTLAPLAWLLVCTLTAAFQKLWHPDPKIGFLAHADVFAAAVAEGRLIAPAKSMEQMEQLIFNDRIDAALCALFAVVVIAVVGFGLRTALRAYNGTATESVVRA